MMSYTIGAVPIYYFIIPAGLATGFVLDILFGDPVWLPHPVVGIGLLISKGEKILRRLLPERRRLAGKLLVASVLFITVVLTAGVLILAWIVSPWLAFAVCAVMSWQALSGRCLQIEAMKVYRCVDADDLPGARKTVSMIVGRDTGNLSLDQVVKATVETVAENTSDGVIAPMLFLALGGPVLGMAYKAINTMDSMIGYKNDRYIDFGRAAAKTDDAVNLIPARITACAMIAVSCLPGFDRKNALKIYKRDRRNHASPNSAQSESVCAGALQIALAGDAYYFGKLYEKPVIGDPIRPIRAADIKASIRLMYGTALFVLPIALVLSALIGAAVWRLI